PFSFSAHHYCSILFFQSYGDLRDLHSFPTRRSSDLWCLPLLKEARHLSSSAPRGRASRSAPRSISFTTIQTTCCASMCSAVARRSEEHTSELQSRFDLVCRLLLEKKKNKKCRLLHK